MINVTKTFLPPIAEYTVFVQRAWDNQWLTNRGELVLELEQKLKEYLEVPYVTAMTNGTIPLQIALKMMGKGGEVITTPFSYVATTASIVWENCKPVFVDINPDYLTIDETQIEGVITDKTTAILATHVFGNPCATDVIEAIAKKYNLAVIYDGAHSFGVRYKNRSIFEYGDLSTCSFHATKLFHSGEGGALFTTNSIVQQQLFYHHNFGHDGPLAFHGLGINGKMSELQAAMGLAVFPYLETIISDRKRVVEFYDQNLDLSQIQTLKIRANTEWNYSYYPVIFKNEAQLLAIQKKLNEHQIFPRRYFYPSLNTLPYVQRIAMPVSESISSRIMCLPLYVDLTNEDLNLIVSLIHESIC
ncbi:DegT/DnrJ/EryC1/StrS family aminotransferase [Flavobacterium sp. SOK18b]|uniref:DegT/DnrJ/EryC1/StrS family aminotransferase n=1 Tax=Flavobacterium sp. SOK18b TaxID=797900 RepID=UPI0015F81920|nr:DegT/DnrJ/EryC1/StrS family aminotransferase [Flavobacterium sp. SOK18b]MBB1192496.1 DegT/DnrJ/EryC1/StrS family aminotransferase [Flavobacterium sp. SOK18b]